ncbi:putative APC membrane recruitment protein 3 [Triplophysa rosa]|uniref:APC membrane recruitment protein 3 n=1 Tax=Triplophysa rosa TaxID=992332 RepID=A0A9W7WXA7_TRIRA|nr:putative APC membrane recruitment protein 3 [Triplophysa rosa]
MELTKSEDSSKDRKNSNKAAAYVHGKGKEGHTLHTDPNNEFVNMHNTVESPRSLTGICNTLCSDGTGQLCSSVKKSKTYDCGRRMGLQQAESPGCKNWANRRHRHKLVTSVSFSGFESPLRLLCENPDTSGSSHEIIDYRNLTPQVPFVPCKAKSIPKKRISLRRPRKAIKDLFGHKRHKYETALSPSTHCRVGGENVPTSKCIKKSSRDKEQTSARNRYNEHSETYSDSSSECCANVCEDVASLKSFGSQSGCGEIFADEECIVSSDGVLNLLNHKEAGQSQRRNHATTGFQGGKECLTSPAQSGVLDMFGMWEALNKTKHFRQSSRTSGNMTETTTPFAKSPSMTKSENVTANSPRLESQIKELNTDVMSLKSDNQENTSDEGYCDYVSPGSEDHSKTSLTPVPSNKFPRDTYSGDALYELFCDPSEAEMTPIFDDELDLTDSVIGQCSDLPLSMYSFHVGAEENLAPPLARDFIGQEFLQSKWMGKDCLLKLCDTEISLSMGIVNWLKHKTDKSNPKSLCTNSEEPGDLCMKYKTQSVGVRKPPRGAPSRAVNSSRDAVNLKERDSSQQGVGAPILDLPPQYDVNTVMSPLVSPESLPKTTTSGVCFKIFNIDSPGTASGDLKSPGVSSPGSGTRSLFVLAINKESLCASCKSSLKNGAKNLFLCCSCMSLIEHIKTSDLWAHASLPHPKTLTPHPITTDPLSPASTCGIASDISIASLVEQCASQLSSMKINITQKHLSCDKRSGLEPAQGVKRNTENRKYLKAKQKKKTMTSPEQGLHVRHCLGRSRFSEDVQKPSLLETEGLGFVTNHGSNDLVLETYSESGDMVTFQTPRPTSLSLMASTSSEFSSGEDHQLKRMEHRNVAKKKHRSSRHKKTAVNSERSGGFVLQEGKVERRCRMKK